MSRIIIATDDADFERRVRTSFPESLNGELQRVDSNPFAHPAGPVTGLAGRPGSATEVVALGPGLSMAAAMDLARRFDVERPEVSVLLVAHLSPGVLEEALRAGVRDVLPPDATAPDLRAAFERALQTASRMRTNLTTDTGSDTPHSRIITVVSPKGGSGKTTVASNLAVGLASGAPGAVVLVDLDLQFGDVASVLRLNPEASILDVARASRLDATVLKAFLTPHPSGLYTLCAPESPAAAEEVGVERVAAVLQLLTDQFRYVIVDTGAGLSEHTLTALESSTDILCLCSMDVPSVRGLRKELEALDLLGMVTQRRHLVLNRADARVGLDADDIEAAVGLPVDVAVPSSRAVPLSMNQGSPVLESDARSPVGRQMTALVNRFADQAAVRSGGRRRRWRDGR